MGGMGAYLLARRAPKGTFHLTIIQMGYGMGTQDAFQIAKTHQSADPEKQTRVFYTFLEYIAPIADKCPIIMQHCRMDTHCAWSDQVRIKEIIEEAQGDVQLVDIPKKCGCHHGWSGE